MEVMAYGHGGTTLDEALHSGPCDAALFNVHLPVESGFSLAARLRLVSDAWLVLLTAAARREDRVLALSLGVDHYRSEEHTSELQSLMRISYAVFFLKKTNTAKLRTSRQYKRMHRSE